MKEIKLIGVDAQGNKVKYAKDVYCFTNKTFTINVSIGDINTLYLALPQKAYVLTKHPTKGYYYGTCNNVKVHIILKKIIGKLLCWD